MILDTILVVGEEVSLIAFTCVLGYIAFLVYSFLGGFFYGVVDYFVYKGKLHDQYKGWVASSKTFKYIASFGWPLVVLWLVIARYSYSGKGNG